MPTEDILLKFGTQGEQTIEQAQHEVERLRMELKALDAQLQSGYIAKGQFDVALKRLTAQLRTAEREFQALSAAAAKSGQGFSINGSNMIQLAYLADDVQYGMRGISNQLPMLGQLVGLSQKSAGAFAILGTSIYICMQNLEEFEQLYDSFQAPAWVEDFREKLVDLKGVLDAVADVEIRWHTGGAFGLPSGDILRERSRTRKAEDAREDSAKRTFESLDALKSQDDEEHAKAFAEAIRSQHGGGQAIREALIGQALAGMSKAEREEKVTLPGGRKLSREEFEKERIADQIGAALGGNAGAIQGIIDRLGGAGSSIGQAYQEALPESVKAKKDAEAAQKDADRERERAEKESQRNREKDVKGLAADLQQRFDQAVLEGKTVKESKVAEELQATGANPELAAEVMQAMAQSLADRISERQRKEGTTYETASADMLKELNEKREREQEAAVKRAEQNSPAAVAEREQRERDSFERRAASRARGAVYGTDQRVQEMLVKGAAMGVNEQRLEDGIATALANALKGHGFTEEEASAGANRIVEENRRRLYEASQRTAGGLMEKVADRQREAWKAPELVKAQDFVAKAQSSTDMAKALDYARSQDAHLVEAVSILQRIENTPSRTRLS